MKSLLILLILFTLSFGTTVQLYDQESGNEYEIEFDNNEATIYDYQTSEYRYLDIDSHDNSIPNIQINEDLEWNYPTYQY